MEIMRSDYTGEGYMCKMNDYDIQLEVLEFLWRDWEELQTYWCSRFICKMLVITFMQQLN